MTTTQTQAFRQEYRKHHTTGSKKLSPKEIEEMAALKSQGYGPKAIGEIIGVSSLTVRYHLSDDVKQQMKKHSGNRARDRHRRSGLTTTVGGKQIVLHGLHKRPYPADGCEICKSMVHLLYHHWDPESPSKGVWVCHKCHNVVEVIDRENSADIRLIREGYISMKNKLDGGS